ncbi:NAD-dependent epimerase/dehydratase family protein [Bradyrhizobium sp. NP1]|uniref:NAD-dependent epimerase/dehydratase family protein n=1 Tax=Bradyrhizobium sp. NP1 TaxID=3049772 RepID=UPI0025A68F00|nr:NAD-dependent epimerase/dehydratase family protein [Bradyrhizobium sp. NP1]WJR76304.1 NAD-dependent epimerase/dehydratase family protein [Bradyrhizobium sp. NP1]
MKDERPRVLVTGASGFVGGHLVPFLASHGWKVRCAARRPRACADEVVVGEIDARTDWRAALTGVEAVLHLAGRAHHPGEEGQADLYRAVNTDGTLQLARSAAAAGVRRFIHVSTILVNGSTTDGRAPFRETDAMTPRGVYGRSKAEAENGLKEIAANSAMAVTVIRPPLIYGAGARGNFELLVRAIRRGVPLPLASIRNRRAFLSVHNLASFVTGRLASAQTGYEIFLVADAEQISTPEFATRIATAVGRSARLVALPLPMLRMALKLAGRAEAGDSLIGSMELDLSRALATGWRPELTLDAALRAALAQPQRS